MQIDQSDRDQARVVLAALFTAARILRGVPIDAAATGQAIVEANLLLDAVAPVGKKSKA